MLDCKIIASCTTTESSAILMTGRKLQNRLDFVKPDGKRTVENHKAQQHSGEMLMRQLHVGQTVAVRECMEALKWVPGVITTRNRPPSYQVEAISTTIWKRPFDQIRESHMLSTHANTSSRVSILIPLLVLR